MPELGYVFYLVALAYAFGQLWYSILDYRHDNVLRVCSYPFLGIIFGEAAWIKLLGLPAGPEYFGIHVLVAFVATLIATLIDQLIHSLRPAHEPSMRPAHA